MSERVVIDYLRTRGRVDPPPGFARSVMAAIDEASLTRSWFAAHLPAAAVTGVLTFIALTALLLGQNPNVGPSPSQTPAPSPSATSATLAELEAAVTAATERLAGGAVEGFQASHIEEYLASATWFDWRPNGGQVVITREDIDVSSPWWADPDGDPLTVGERVDTRISVLVDGAMYRSDDGAWVVEDAPTGPLTYGIGLLSGQISPVVRGDARDDVRVTRREVDDGYVAWRLAQLDSDTAYQEWRIGSDGVLASYMNIGARITVGGVDVSQDPDESNPTALTRSLIEFTPAEDAEPISAPDLDTAPDPAALGLPADFPLAVPEPPAGIDYREYVEVVLDALETYHWNAGSVDWAAVRSAGLDRLPDEPTAGQAHQRIIDAIQTFDTFNTVFVRPGDVPAPDAAAGPPDLPEGDRIGEIAVVTLPTSTGPDPEALQQYLEAARDQMAAADGSEPACGWIVDVRVAGGAHGPLFAAIGGLLGEGRVITFDSAVSDWWVDVDASGTVSFGSEAVTSDLLDSPMFAAATADAEREQAEWEALLARERPYRPAADDLPVVVVTSSATASAGEQLVVGFQGRSDSRTIGSVTAGSPHGLLALRMADGALLRLPTSTPVDRDGTRYSSNVIPDDVVADRDAAIDAAVDWLESQPGCS